MVNTCEAVLNVVTKEQAEDAVRLPRHLTRLGQNGTWSGPRAPNSCGADVEPPAESCDLPHSATSVQRGKPVGFPQGAVNRKGIL